MRRLMLAMVLMSCGVALAASDPTTQPAPQPKPGAVAAEPATRPAWTPYSTGRQQRRGSDNGRGRRSGGFSEATSRPDVLEIASSGPIPQDFEILNYRNIFYKGHLPSPESVGRSEPVRIELHSVETNLIFNGVTITDGKPSAFLENTDQGSVVQVHVGDMVARGKIVSIALDSLEYQLTGQTQTTHVQIGQNLAGGNGWGTVASSQPSSTGSATADAMLEKLRQKRAAELNGK
jgi:hypothetical protein